MDLRQLRYFVQIVESGSLSKAARQLFIAQPALSYQVAKLEEEVGKPVLVRSARGVLPTENGEALYQHAKFLLRKLDDALSIARDEPADISGRVTLGVPPTTVTLLGMPLLKRLQQKYPGIRLNVVACLSGHLETMARANQLDIAVMFNPHAASELAVEPLLEEDLFLLVAADNPLVAASKRSISLAEIARLPLVMPSGRHGLRRRIELEFERAGLSVQPVAEIDSLMLLMQYAAETHAVTIQPLAARLVTTTCREWRCLTITDTSLVRLNYLFTLPLPDLSPAAATVRTELKQVVRELVGNGDWPGVRLAGEATGNTKAKTVRRRA